MERRSLTWALFFYEEPERLSCTAEYAGDLFEPETMRRMLGHLKTPDHRGGDPTRGTDQPVAPVDRCGAGAGRGEMERLTHREFPQGQCVHELVEAQALLHARRHGAGVSPRKPDLPAIEQPGQPCRAASAFVGRRAGSFGRDLRGTLAGNGHRNAGGIEGGRRLCAFGSGVSKRAVGVHSGRCQGAGTADAGAVGVRSATASSATFSFWTRRFRSPRTPIPRTVHGLIISPTSSTLPVRRGKPKGVQIPHRALLVNASFRA